MAAAKRRRRLPTLVNRGLGLIEVILPRGSSEEAVSPLPEGRRDDSGFWFPVGYDQPGDIFTPQQRQLQAKQRAIQRSRRSVAAPPSPPPGATAGSRVTPDQARVVADQSRVTPDQGRGARDRNAGAVTPVSGGVKTAARDPDGSMPTATRVDSGAGVAVTAPVNASSASARAAAAPVIAAILGGGFGVREMEIPLPPARLESDTGVAVHRPRDAAVSVSGRRVDSPIPSE